MTTNSNIRFFLLALAACCVVAGCDVRAPVSGKVTYPDGEPLSLGEVRGFDGVSTHIRAEISEDGTFELYEVKRGDRVPAGRTYEIFIANAETRPEPPAGVIFPPSVPPIEHVHPKFSNPSMSEIRLVVPKSSKPVKFDIEVQKP